MKKIININLSGRVVPIEDVAYEKLQAYIESLRRYFANEEGRDEIINDIESRIAEIMSEKVRLGAAAITDADVNEIIASMGRPEDFDAVDNEPATASSASRQQGQQQEQTYTKKRRRLYRDSTDKIIGGVCAGLANYMNVDPAIIRLLFAIITFGGFGFGILIYIILWIVLPVTDLDEFKGKRLYRDADNKIIGGVGGGLAAYFGREPWLIRLIFAAPMILNIFFRILRSSIYHEGSFVPGIVFGSLAGTFILAYIILWIVLPEARSQYQKMEMRGEKVDVNTIRQNVQDEMHNVKGRMKEWGQEVKGTAAELGGKAKEFANTRGRAFANEAGDAARRTGRRLGHVIAVLFKVFFLFIAGTIAFGLFVGLLGLVFGGIGIWPLKNFILDGFWQNTFAWGTLVLFLGVPLVGFIIWVLRRIMRVRSQSNYLGWTFGGLWTLGWISVACFVSSMMNDFRMSNGRMEPAPMTITQPVNGKMIVKVSEPEVEYSGSMPWIDIDGSGLDVTRDTLRLANVKIMVELSKDAAYHVDIKKFSRGRTVADANEKAQKMLFSASYQDSVLDVSSGITISKESKFRGQQAIVIIHVPAGKKIRFDESIRKLHDFNVHIGDSRRWNRRNRDYDYYEEDFNYGTGIDYTMDSNGELKDPEGKTPNYNYRYGANDSRTNQATPSDSNQNFEELKRQIHEESERKIREIEKQQKESGKKSQ
ncbi:MAG TPA: PspC domain-containing protein [Chitinophagaceae bacterium]|nr:PspC domain-containing protein [Chitinophagaceae bacterium]